MSAALQVPFIQATGTSIQQWRIVRKHAEPPAEPVAKAIAAPPVDEPGLKAGVAFYRKHTEKMLRRYLYASMLVGRAPAILGESIGRGWVSSRKVKTFEDAVIFVLDIERCLKKLGPLDCALLSRVTLQEYTHAETADILGVSLRAISYKYPLALDRLTELLLQDGLLILPHS